MSLPLSILWVDHVTRILGGAEVNLLELLEEPGARDAWRSVVACDPDGRLSTVLDRLGVERRAYGFDPALGALRVVGARFRPAAVLRSLLALRRARRHLAGLIAAVRPQVVVSCTNKDHFAAWPACRAAGIPSVWWVNDVVSAEFFPWPARRAFRAQGRRGASRMVVVSDFARQALLHLGLPGARVVTIHNGIPLDRYRRQPRGALRDQLGLDETAWLVGILGRWTPWKGQELFLRIAEAWCRESEGGHFALIGHAFNEDQAFERALKERVTQRGLGDRVRFVPFQPDVAAALSDLDLLLHTSLRPEPFGRVLIEAMAVGVPVIAARDGGVPEILRHGVDGFLAAPGDPDAYLAAMREVRKDAAGTARRTATARDTVASRFSLERVRGAFDRLLREVACAS